MQKTNRLVFTPSVESLSVSDYRLDGTKAFSKLIAEGRNRHWSAWFLDLPWVAVRGESPTDAIKLLLERIGNHNFDAIGIVALENRSRDGHLEFLVPLLGFRRIPAPSKN